MTVKDFTVEFSDKFISLLSKCECSDAKRKPISLDTSLENVLSLLEPLHNSSNKLMIIGNGGSAGIASHMSTDFSKNGGIRSMSFNDSSLLTCLSNDYSYEEVFAKAIEFHAFSGDILFCISSSGSSKNIINAAIKAKSLGVKIITFTGFDGANPLRQLGEFNYFIPSRSYGHVEIAHLFLIHLILDAKLYCHNSIDIFNANVPFP